MCVDQRHELSLAGIFQESLAEIGADIDRAEDIAASAMIKAGDGAENFALSTFAGARRAKKKERFINHDNN